MFTLGASKHFYIVLSVAMAEMTGAFKKHERREILLEESAVK